MTALLWFCAGLIVGATFGAVVGMYWHVSAARWPEPARVRDTSAARREFYRRLYERTCADYDAMGVSPEEVQP